MLGPPTRFRGPRRRRGNACDAITSSTPPTPLRCCGHGPRPDQAHLERCRNWSTTACPKRVFGLHPRRSRGPRHPGPRRGAQPANIYGFLSSDEGSIETSRLSTASLCCSVVLLSGCRSANSPENTIGVQALYRAIGIDSSAGNFSDICQNDMDSQLRSQVRRSNNDCVTSSSTSNLERWAEKLRLSKFKAGTRIVVSGHQALVYDGPEPEKVIYIAGRWLLAEAPALTSPRTATK